MKTEKTNELKAAYFRLQGGSFYKWAILSVPEDTETPWHIVGAWWRKNADVPRWHNNITLRFETEARARRDFKIVFKSAIGTAAEVFDGDPTEGGTK